MSPIVCQVIYRPERVTFVWSQAGTSFEPYHLAGEELEAFDLAAQLARERLAQAVFQPHASSELELARAGRQLYQAMIPESARHIRNWLHDQHNQSHETGLEILSDLPGHVPWNLVYDQAPEEGVARTAFWGFRLALGVGRRVNPLRVASVLESPSVMIAVDPELLAHLPVEQTLWLSDLARSHQSSLLESVEDLKGALTSRAPDVLWLLARVQGGRLAIGADTFGVDSLRDLLADATQGNPDPIVMLSAVGDALQLGSWRGILGVAAASLAGVITSEVPTPAAVAAGFGFETLNRFLTGGSSLGEVLRDMRVQFGYSALAFSGFCPGFVRVARPGETIDPEVAPSAYPLPEAPYHPLAPLEREQRALLQGRADDIVRCAQLVGETRSRGLVVHGHGGAGKSSFLRAGLIPHLEEEAVGYWALRDRSPQEQPCAEADFPVLAIRPGSDLTGQIADALCAFCAQPYHYGTPTGHTVIVDLPALLRDFAATGLSHESSHTEIAPGEPSAAPLFEKTSVTSTSLWQALNADHRRLAGLLDALTARLPFELVLPIEQGEELVTLANDRSTKERRRQALTMLQFLFGSSARCKVILALRTEFYGQFADHWPAGQEAWREFFLGDLNYEVLVETLLLPTSTAVVAYTSEVPREKYQFAFEDGLAHLLVRDIWVKARDHGQSAVSLVQAAGALLYDRARARRLAELRDVDRKELGDVENLMVRIVEEAIRPLPLSGSGQDGLQFLLDKLHTNQGNGVVTRALLPLRVLQGLWMYKEPIQRVVDLAAGAGLLSVQSLLVDGNESLHVSLTQDALARAGIQQEGARKLNVLGRRKVIDTLWIMIPLMLLGVAITWSLTRSMAARNDGGDSDFTPEQAKRIQDHIKAKNEEQVRSTRWPIYAGFVARAQLAHDAGNSLLARQHLLTQLPLDGEKDVRGFDWYYLWRQLHRAQRTISGQRSTVLSLAASRDGRTFASGGADGVVKLWDVASGKILADFIGHQGPVATVAFAPGGKTLATAGADKWVRIWNIPAGKGDFEEVNKESAKLEGHTAAILALAFGKDDTVLASAGEDGKVILWNTAKAKAEATLTEHKGEVNALAFADDGTLVTGGDDRKIVVRGPAAGKPKMTIDTGGPVRALAFTPGRKTLAVGCDERQRNLDAGVVRIWDLSTGKETARPLYHAWGILALTFVSDGKLLVSAGKDNRLHCWDHAAGVQVASVVGHLGWVRSLATAAGGRTLVSGSFDAKIMLWDAAKLVEPDVLPTGCDSVQAIAFSHDDKVLVSGGPDGVAKVWHPESGGLLCTLPGHMGSITSLKFLKTPEKAPRKLAVGSYGDKGEGEIKLWEIDADGKGPLVGKEVRTFKEIKGVLSLAVSSSGDTLVAGGVGGAVTVWDVASGKLRNTMLGHVGDVRTVAFVPDSQVVFSGGADGSIRFWDSVTGMEKGEAVPNVHPGGVNCIAFFLGNVGYVTAGADRTVKVWAWQEGKPAFNLHALRGLSQSVSCLAASPLGDFVAAGSVDKSVRLFDMVPGNNTISLREGITLTGHHGPVRAIAVSANRLTIASVGEGGVIRFWRALPEADVNPVPER